MKKVIVLGSLNMDLSIFCEKLPKEGETINGTDFLASPGGKGGNQAVAAAKLGANTYMIGSVGSDVFGKQMIYELSQYHINTDYIKVDPKKPSGVAMVICNNKDNRIILGNGANYSLTAEEVREGIKWLGKPGDLFLTQLENDPEVVYQSLHYAKQKGMTTVFNPAPACHIKDDVYKAVDLLIMNQTECNTLSGILPKTEEECERALDFFQEKGAFALITLGDKGSVFREGGNLIWIPAKKVDVVDTTGAGDAYIGALCARLTKGESIAEALKFSTEVAAICVTRRGAQAAIPWEKEVREVDKERT